jgi:hypothetical protein
MRSNQIPILWIRVLSIHFCIQNSKQRSPSRLTGHGTKPSYLGEPVLLLFRRIEDLSPPGSRSPAVSTRLEARALAAARSLASLFSLINQRVLPVCCRNNSTSAFRLGFVTATVTAASMNKVSYFLAFVSMLVAAVSGFGRRAVSAAERKGGIIVSAMQCNAMQCNAMQCNAMQCNAMQCNVMQCDTMLRKAT